MKAVVCPRYGPPEVLRLKEVEKPVPRDDEVLIKIRATTVTSTDCNMRNLTFVPGLFRLPVRLFMVGPFRPKVHRLGVDLAGEIKAVGKDVRRFKVGDHVLGTPGDAGGAHAEYICMPEDGVLTRKPANLTWEEAASIPLAGNTALHFIRDLGKIRAGQPPATPSGSIASHSASRWRTPPGSTRTPRRPRSARRSPPPDDRAS